MNAKAGDVLTSLMPIGLIFVVFYFFIIRPQQKKAKEHRDMLSSVSVGDVVLTSSGIIGTVRKVPEGREIEVEIFTGVVCKMLKSAVVEIISRKSANVVQSQQNHSSGRNFNKGASGKNFDKNSTQLKNGEKKSQFQKDKVFIDESKQTEDKKISKNDVTSGVTDFKKKNK